METACGMGRHTIYCDWMLCALIGLAFVFLVTVRPYVQHLVPSNERERSLHVTSLLIVAYRSIESLCTLLQGKKQCQRYSTSYVS
jgi:hypothetical protein